MKIPQTETFLIQHKVGIILQGFITLIKHQIELMN